MMKRILFLLLLLVSTNVQAQSTKLVIQAQAFLKSLTVDQRRECLYDSANEERFNWHFVPRARKGIALKNLTTVQQQAALQLLDYFLSDQGVQKANNIISNENILRVLENRGVEDTYRDALNYSITFFGTPSDQHTWHWRLEGHHLSLNVTCVQGKIESATPTFWGSNPAIVPSGKVKGKQVLQQEMAFGFALINSLTVAQQKIAVINDDAPSDIISFNQRKAEALQPLGITYKNLSTEQQKTMLSLLQVYVTNYELGFSDKLMSKIEKAGIDKLSFAWAGSLKPGAGHYYRIQGPMLLIEYDNTQNQANHIHTTVRDLTNDFAEDILRDHYQRHHQK